MARRRVILPPTKAPKVTAGLRWPPEMLKATETATKRANACAKATAIRAAGVAGASSVSLLRVMLEPSPANTNIRVAMNSAAAAFIRLGMTMGMVGVELMHAYGCSIYSNFHV